MTTLPKEFLDRFRSDQVLPEVLPASPFAMLQEWYDRAWREKRTPNPNAMTLATIGPDGLPQARIVLCRGLEVEAGAIAFFTNRRSDKGLSLTANPSAALVFHWDHWDVQARVVGPVLPTSEAESDAYFQSRRWESRLAACASDQSRPIPSRAALIEKLGAALRAQGLTPEGVLAAGNDARILRPAHWGGWRIMASRVELWMGNPTRLHDRAAWTREVRRVARGSAEEFEVGPWSATRLQP